VATIYSAIYSFGDSLSDAGDAYLLTSSTDGAALGLQPEPVSPPYAQETYGGTQADVFSNGMVWVQDLATTLGLPNVAPGQVGATGTQLLAAGVPSYVVAALDGGNPSNYVTITPGASGGTDFAIGGSVTGPTDFNTSGAAALTDLQSQIANFQHEITTPLVGALYTVWSGSNDLLNLLSSSAFASQSVTTSQAEVAQSAQNEVNAVISLVDLGAKTVLVGDVPNLGLIPEITAEGSIAEQTATAYSQYFNIELQTDLQGAMSQLAGAAVTVLDVFGLLTATTPNTVVPGPNGGTITDTTDPAYTGSFTADNGTLAANADNYLYFDQLHPTQTGHQAIANLAASDLGVACYCGGTLIRTPEGDIAVEALCRGGAVLNEAGQARIIRWIGRRSYAGRFLAANAHVQPVRFIAGSLGDGLPRRDLLVSPEHAMSLDGMLIPARCLLNGRTIVQERGLTGVDYYHVELDSHDLLLAEGAPSESYLDDDSRLMFHNAAEFAALYPDAAEPGKFCAPRLTDGYQLEAIRRRLAAVANVAAEAA
jgi:phospholipase/lecithinase/hemolysin